jgi:hypothetical protein
VFAIALAGSVLCLTPATADSPPTAAECAAAEAQAISLAGSPPTREGSKPPEGYDRVMAWRALALLEFQGVETMLGPTDIYQKDGARYRLDLASCRAVDPSSQAPAPVSKAGGDKEVCSQPLKQAAEILKATMATHRKKGDQRALCDGLTSADAVLVTHQAALVDGSSRCATPREAWIHAGNSRLLFRMLAADVGQCPLRKAT